MDVLTWLYPLNKLWSQIMNGYLKSQYIWNTNVRSFWDLFLLAFSLPTFLLWGMKLIPSEYTIYHLKRFGIPVPKQTFYTRYSVILSSFPAANEAKVFNKKLLSLFIPTCNSYLTNLAKYFGMDQPSDSIVVRAYTENRGLKVTIKVVVWN